MTSSPVALLIILELLETVETIFVARLRGGGISEKYFQPYILKAAAATFLATPQRTTLIIGNALLFFLRDSSKLQNVIQFQNSKH